MIALKQRPEPIGGPRAEARRAAKGAIVVKPPHDGSFCEVCELWIPCDVPYLWSEDWHVAGHTRGCIRRAVANGYDAMGKQTIQDYELETKTA